MTTDLAAFYQYVDHAVLRDELDLTGADIRLVDGLVGMLADIEGRRFGIPQRSEPSDWISELYAARLERWLIRDGFDVWRYSDDFRVGCETYSDALSAIESLARTARDVGLVLNDQKTATPSFLTYLTHNVDVEVNDVSARIDPSDVEAAVSSDYPLEDDEQAVADAEYTIDRLWDPEHSGRPRAEDDWNLRSLDADQHRAVRRALNTLTRHNEPAAMPKLLSLLAYQPAMTHRIVTYCEFVSSQGPGPVEGFFDAATSRLSLNEWQRGWLAYGFRACAIPLNATSPRAVWLAEQLDRRSDSMPAAEAAVTLAAVGLVSFEPLEEALRTVSADFAPWYLHAVGLLHGHGTVSASQLGSLRHSSPSASAILR